MYLRIICIILISFHAVTYAQQTTRENDLILLVKNYLIKRAQQEQVSVVTLAAQTAKNKNYAVYATLNPRQIIHEDNLFQIGSLTKSFIAVIILQLEADQRYHLNINNAITVYFPQFKNWHNVKIKNLLNMTSGIPDFLDTPYFFAELSQHPFQPSDIKKWLNIMYERNLLFRPGQRFNYSNTNYFILGLLIEKLTGHPLRYEIKQRLIKPLQLKNTFYRTNYLNKNLRDKMIHGYQFQNGYAKYIPLQTDVTLYNMSYAGPAAGIVSNSIDIMKWAKALFQPGKLLNETQLKKLTTLISEKTGKKIKFLTQQDPQGFGLGIRAIYYPLSKNSFVYAYEGLTLGYRAIYVYSPAEQTLVAATVNSNYHTNKNYLFALINQVFKKINS